MHGRRVIHVNRTNGLVAERTDRRAKVELPKTYTKESIPSRREQIPTPAMTDKWPHLRKIKNKIPKVDNNLDVGLLIGCNCPKAMKPREVITGKSEDPYAVLTLLGWCIVRPTDPADQDNKYSDSECFEESGSCNRIVACEIGREDRELTFVLNQKTIEYVVDPAAVVRMLNLDFAERKDFSPTSLSKEDKQFLAIAKKGIHRTLDTMSFRCPSRTTRSASLIIKHWCCAVSRTSRDDS